MKKSPPSEVRLVRCPRCREVLPEPTDVPFYRCGGCSATLQAKHYRKESEGTETASGVSDSAQNDERVQSARDGEPSHLSAQLVSSDQYSSGQIEGINNGAAQNGSIENLGVSSSNMEAPPSDELNHQPSSSSVKHFQVLAQEGDLNLGITSTIQADSSRNELCTPSYETPSNLIPKYPDSSTDMGSSQTSVAKTEKKASSSNQELDDLNEKLNSLVVREEEKTSGLNPSLKGEVSAALDQHGNVEAEELISLAKKSQKAAEAGTSYRNLPKSPMRNSSAYDGSVSSSDAIYDQPRDQIPSETMETTNNAENKAFSANESFHSAEQSIPALLNEIKMSEALRRGRHRRNTRRPKTEESPTRVPHYRRFSGMSYEPIREELYDHPAHYPPYRYRRSEADERIFSKRLWMGEELQMRSYHESSGEIYRHSRRPIYRPPVHNLARRPYTTEMRREHYRVHESYSHLHPYDMRWSSEFPPPGAYQGRGRYIARGPFDSYPPSPQVFSDSEYYACSHGRISEDQRISRLQLTRNSQPVQHFHPIAGAAPFITCYCCSELLQLPPDFLLFKGVRIHRVKCSACSSILKFALERGRRLVPYVSKKDDFQGNSSAALHRRSVSASASVYVGSSQIRDSGKQSACSSSETPEQRRSEAKGKSKVGEMHNNTAATSPDIPRHSKVTWIMPARSTSPLHRLMGYSSPSAVLYGSGSGEEHQG